MKAFTYHLISFFLAYMIIGIFWVLTGDLTSNFLFFLSGLLLPMLATTLFIVALAKKRTPTPYFYLICTYLSLAGLYWFSVKGLGTVFYVLSAYNGALGIAMLSVAIVFRKNLRDSENPESFSTWNRIAFEHGVHGLGGIGTQYHPNQPPRGLDEIDAQELLAMAVECHASNEQLRGYDLYILKDGRVLIKFIDRDGGALYASPENFKTHSGIWPSGKPERNYWKIILIAMAILIGTFLAMFILVRYERARAYEDRWNNHGSWR